MSTPVKRSREAWIEGARCKASPPTPLKPYRLVLLGAPGVGKGTQAELLSAALGACHLSTGDVFRAARKLDSCEVSPSMAAALECMRKGELVQDETVLNIVRERTKCLRCRGGFLLDGFPRTVAQAQALEQILAQENVRLDAVLDYELPIEMIVSRLSGRRTCPSCKAVYHVAARPPKAEGICDQCGGQLFQREDDRPEAVRVRMQAYDESTRPLIDYYRARGLLVSVSAEGSPEEIRRCTIDALAKRALSLYAAPMGSANAEPKPRKQAIVQ